MAEKFFLYFRIRANLVYLPSPAKIILHLPEKSNFLNENLVYYTFTTYERFLYCS